MPTTSSYPAPPPTLKATGTHRTSTQNEAKQFKRPVVQKGQWEVDRWCKVLEQGGRLAGLIYCMAGISPGDLEKLPLTSGYAYVP